MSAREPHRCVLCGELVAAAGPGVFDLTMGADNRRGSCVTLRWCRTCAEADPLQMAMAEADADGTDDDFARCYLAIIDRCRAEAPAQLRARVDVRRDTDMPGMTLRGRGDDWGRITRR